VAHSLRLFASFFARPCLAVAAVRRVELHWYEAHGIGRRDVKIKSYLDQP
jgi:hypothetical protein